MGTLPTGAADVGARVSVFREIREHLCAGVKDGALEANKDSLQSLYEASKETG